MREVSARACETLLASLEHERISPSEWLADLPIDPDTLRDPASWIDWDLYVTLIERFEELAVTMDPMFAAGMRLLDDPTIVENRELAGAFHDLDQLYRLGGRVKTAVYFAHLRRSCERLAGGRYRIVNEIPRSYRGCEAFFRMRAGMVKVTPRLLGLSDSDVQAQITPHRGEFIVKPPRETLTKRLVRRRGRRTAVERSLQLLASAEEKLRDRRSAALDAYGTSGSAARAALDALAVPLLVIDLWGDDDARIFGLNRRMELETGLRDRDVAGRRVADVFAEGGGAWLGALWSCVELRRVVPAGGWETSPERRVWLVPTLNDAGEVVRVYVSSLPPAASPEFAA